MPSAATPGVAKMARCRNLRRPRLTRACVLAVAVGLAIAGPAPAASTYAIYGDGDQPLRPGILASDAEITDGPIGLATRTDGVTAFSTGGSVYWIQDGRLLRVPVPSDGVRDLAFAPDGRLLVASCGDRDDPDVPAAVYDAAPGRAAAVIAGRPGRMGSSGDGGPATNATLRCPSGVDVDADGGILIADLDANRIRHVAPDGIITTVAGTGAIGTAGDGGPATQASLTGPNDVAALPGGGFAFVDLPPTLTRASRMPIRTVDRTGIIHTLLRTGATRLSATPDGALLLVDWTDPAGAVRRLQPDGTLTTLASIRRDAAGIPPYIPVAGDPFASDNAQADTAVATPDGGALVGAALATGLAIDYIAPPTPALLGLAILPATRRPARRLTVSIRTTIPGRLRISVWKRGRRVASTTTEVPGGDAAIPITTALRPGDYEVRARAMAGAQTAGARATVLVGGLLPVSYARGFIRSRLELFETFENAGRVRLRCRRMARGRVDCAMRQPRRCAGIATVRIRPDGTLSVAQYDGGRRCRFRR
jgi:hypothetical protein